MKVLVTSQENLSIPQICCICGAANPTIKYKQTKETKGIALKASVKMTFMKCQACVDELNTISRIWTRMSSRGTFIGGGIGLLAGIAITLTMWLQIGYFSPEKTNDIINDLIGPFFACASVPAAFGMIIGLIIVKATWLKRINPSIRQRLEILKFPVKILVFGFEEGWFGIGGIKKPMLTLYFANDNYGQTFMRLNNGFLASVYCSKCGNEVDPDRFPVLRASICTDCKKIFCETCLQIGWKGLPCPECGKPTKHANTMRLVQIGVTKSL